LLPIFGPLKGNSLLELVVGILHFANIK